MYFSIRITWGGEERGGSNSVFRLTEFLLTFTDYLHGAEVFALLRCYTALIGSFETAHRTLNNGTDRLSLNVDNKLGNIPEERRSHTANEVRNHAELTSALLPYQTVLYLHDTILLL
jgi:hypothetical protein